MANPLEQARFDALVDQSGLGDRALAAMLGVDQSTAWRLRHGKIAKMSVYTAKLETHLGITGTGEDASEDVLVSDLVALARHSPGLKQALIALRKIMHNHA
jgi:hypothetical protein